MEQLIVMQQVEVVPKNGKVQIDSAPQWQGTIIHVKLNSDVPVALNKIFGDNIPTSVDEYSDLINGLC